MQRANALLAERLGDASLATIDGAAHFMITSDAAAVGRLIADHVHGAAAQGRARASVPAGRGFRAQS